MIIIKIIIIKIYSSVKLSRLIETHSDKGAQFGLV